MKTLTEQLEKQHQIEQQLEPIESKISEFLHQKEIFDNVRNTFYPKRNNYFRICRNR